MSIYTRNWGLWKNKNPTEGILADKPKVLYLMAGHPSIFGGGKRVFLQLMTHLNKKEFQFYSCCALNKDQESFLSKQDGIIVHIDIQDGGIWPPMKKLINILRAEKIDIIHSQGARADFYARLASKLAGQKTKVVNTIAMLVERYDVGILRKNIYCGLDRFSERHVDRFLVVSEALKQELISTHSIPEHKVAVIFNGIELQEYRDHGFAEFSGKTRREFDIGDREFLVCAIGRMVWQKGFEYLIESIPAIIKTSPRAKILIVGDGPLKARLEALAETLNVRSNLIFAGFRSDTREILSAIDILTVPSVLEGFPMITLEAMAMSKPIIATNIDGITEQITNEENGILVPPKDPDALAKAIIRVYDDKEIGRKMGLAARRKVEREFSVERMVAETEKVYMTLLETTC